MPLKKSVSMVGKRPKIIFEKKYVGFESLQDLDSDVCESFNTDFNPVAKEIPGEFEGTVHVLITYTPAEGEKK